MPQNTPKDEKWLLRRLAELEKRVASLETSPRVGNTSVSGGKLTVGAPDSDDRIEIDAGESRIRFYSPDGPGDVYAPGGSAGVRLEAAQDAGTLYPTFGVQGFTWNTPDSQSLQVNRVEGSTAYPQASVDTGVVVDGSGNSAGQASFNAQHRGLPDSALINLFSDGGVIIYNRGRSTDPPTAGADAVVLYVKSNRLYYRDGAGTVRGPL